MRYVVQKVHGIAMEYKSKNSTTIKNGNDSMKPDALLKASAPCVA